MAIALVGSVSATPGATGGATAAIDTTGATLTIISVSWYGFTTNTPTISDSKGNIYTALTLESTGGFPRYRLFYKLNPIVGSGHTFSATGPDLYCVIIAYAFSGVNSYHSESGANGNVVSSIASGNLTPSANGSLIITGLCGGDTTTDTVTTPSGFTVTQVAFSSGVNMQGSAAYLVQTTATTVNPTWSVSPIQGYVAVRSAVFLPLAITEGRVSQLPVEVVILSDAPITANVSQLPVEVIVLPLVTTETTQFYIITG